MSWAYFGNLRPDWFSELVTTKGLMNMTKLAAARAAASLKDKDAHNCFLLFEPRAIDLARMDVVAERCWKAQARAALEIIKHEQRLALLRAGISVSWLAVQIQTALPHRKDLSWKTDTLKQDTWLAILGEFDHEDDDQVGIAFRLPGKDDPKAFEERLRQAGLVGGKLKVWSRSADEIWKTLGEKPLYV